MPLEFLFGHKKTPEEMLRQNQRALTKAMRDLDRERAKMENQEKKVIADISAMPRQMDAVKIMAKPLVRIRTYVKAFNVMEAKIKATSSTIQMLAPVPMAEAMKALIMDMLTMNKQLKNQPIHDIMKKLAKQSKLQDMKKEIKKTTYAMGDADDEEESDALVSQVLDELGLQMADELSDLPNTGTTVKAIPSKVPAAQAAGGGVTIADLEARLENLKLP